MSWALVALFAGTAALLTVGFYAFSPHAGIHRDALMSMIVISLLACLVNLIARNRQPRLMFTAWVLLAIMIASGVTSDAGAGSAAWAGLYFWAFLFACYFFSRRLALLTLATIAVSYAAVLVFAHPSSHAPATWLLTIVTLAGAGLLVLLQTERIAHVRRSARRDPLTGLHTRPAFDERLELELERVKQTNRPLAVMLVELDSFKGFSDRYGHAAADRALHAAARALRSQRRSIDCAARTSSCEFVMLLPETDARQAWFVAERFQQELADAFSAEPMQLSSSIGLACAPRDGLSAGSLLDSADQALRVAKRLGGGRSVIYEPELIAEFSAEEASQALTRQSGLAAVLVLAESLDLRDSGTARHSHTVGRLAELTARELGLTAARIERLRLAGILHDVGKIAISDSILLKPSALSEEQMEEMKKHPALGARMVSGAGLDDIASWILAHHERPDGRGYPFGLDDDQIPFEAKILAVCDSYEAMTADRIYSPPMPPELAKQELVELSGAQFDPQVVQALIAALAAGERDEAELLQAV